MSIIGKPFGGIRPRRLYDIVGQRAFPKPFYRWFRNVWGDEFRISPHYHIDRCMLAFGCYDPDLHRAMEALIRPGMVCFDIGANLGEMSLHMARLAGPDGCVHAFEPLPQIYERLAKHVEHNDMSGTVHCHQLAISNKNGIELMSCPSRQSDNQGLGSLSNLGVYGDMHEEVTVMTLDTFACEHEITAVNFIKLDIQGGEYACLEGARELLSRFSPIIITEVSPSDLECSGYSSYDLCSLLHNLGYQIHKLSRHGIGKKIPLSNIKENFASTNIVCLR